MNKNKFLLLIFFILISHNLYSDTSQKNENIVKYINSDKNFNLKVSEYNVSGISMLNNNILKKNISFNLNNFSNILLISSGIRKKNETDKIKINNNFIKPAFNDTKLIDNKILYFNVYKIQNSILKNKNFISNFQTDKINQQYIFGGFTLIKYNKGNKNNLKIISVLDKLNAFSIYEHHIKNIFSEEFFVIGGHARKGNGSLTSINNVIQNETEQWSSNSGQFWDILKFKIKQNNNIIIKTDTLLQYLYLCGIIID